jgi:hypothetical protein
LSQPSSIRTRSPVRNQPSRQSRGDRGRSPDSGWGLPASVARVAIARGKGGVGGGSAYYTLRFTNTSDDTCTMTGFPTVSMVTAENGVRVGGPSGECDEGSSCGGEEVALVALTPGDVAHAKVQQANGGNLDPDECDPQPVGGLVVTPPDDTSSVFVTAGGTGCANPEIGLIQVGAITSGPGEG